MTISINPFITSIPPPLYKLALQIVEQNVKIRRWKTKMLGRNVFDDDNDVDNDEGTCVYLRQP